MCHVCRCVGARIVVPNCLFVSLAKLKLNVYMLSAYGLPLVVFNAKPAIAHDTFFNFTFPACTKIIKGNRSSFVFEHDRQSALHSPDL